jgi:antitoxin VapB
MAYAVQIANPQLVQKIEWLAKTMNIGKTAVIDRAVELLSEQLQGDKEPKLAKTDAATKTTLSAEQLLFLEIVERMHKTPIAPNTVDPFNWDDHGLPT